MVPVARQYIPLQSSSRAPYGRLRLSLGHKLGVGLSRRRHELKALAYAPAQVSESADACFEIGLNFYEILDVSSRAQTVSIMRRVKDRKREAPSEDFSDLAMDARNEVLDLAVETLSEQWRRDEYNQLLEASSNETVTERLSLRQSIGALMLLYESGRIDNVILHGPGLISKADVLSCPAEYRRDIRLVTALAYVELSRDAMNKEPPKLIQGFDALDASFGILQDLDENFAKTLRTQISSALEHLLPDYHLHLLALPLDEKHASARQESLVDVRRLLFSKGSIQSEMKRRSFMDAALSHMTAFEQMVFFSRGRKEYGESVNLLPSDMYTEAIALLGEGFARRQPRHIEEALGVFEALHSLFISRRRGNVESDSDSIIYEADEREQKESESSLRIPDVRLELAVSAMLLGLVDLARETLDLTDSSDTPRRHPSRCEAANFVVMNSEPDDNEYLSGLCYLTEQWLAEVPYRRFRDLSESGGPISLSAYFDDPHIANYLEKRGKGFFESLAVSTRFYVTSTMKRVLQPLKRFRIRENPAFAAKAILDISPSKSNLKSRAETVVAEETIKEARKSDEKLLTSSNEVIDQADAKNKVDLEPSFVREDHNQTNGSKWSMPIAFGSAMCVGIYIAASKSGRELNFPSVPIAAICDNIAPIKAISENFSFGFKSESMDNKTAEKLVRKWQKAKAASMGRRHNISVLDDVLTGQMFTQWESRAMEVKSNKYYWDYKLEGLRIDRVALSEGGSTAIVEATIQESAQLCDQTNPDVDDSYRSTYCARYECIKVNGKWKVSTGSVLR